MPIYKAKGKKDNQQKYYVRINYQDQNGVNKSLQRTVYGMEAAKQAELNLNYQVKEVAPETRLTFGELVKEYLGYKVHEVRTSSYDKSVQRLRDHCEPFFKDIKIAKVNAAKVRAWKVYINEKGLKYATKDGIYSELNALLNYAVKMSYLHSNPLKIIGGFKDVELEEANGRIRYYTVEEFKLFKETAYAQAVTLRDYCFYTFFMIAYYTGMRKGEINALKWSDIDGSIIHVRRSYSQKVKKNKETVPKNKSSIRELQMPLPLIEALEAHKLRLGDKRTDDWRVCGGPDVLSDTSIDGYNRLIAKTAGLKHISVHEYRHSHASLLANEGINIQEIARRLGHSNVQITWKTYAHLYPREEERAITILNNV